MPAVDGSEADCRLKAEGCRTASSPTAYGLRSTTLTYQQKLVRAKAALKAAGFMVLPRSRPNGKEGVWVYASVPVPFEDFTLSDEEMADHAADWIKARAAGSVRPPLVWNTVQEVGDEA